MTGFICGPKLYEYDGWLFEIDGYSGPWPLRKDGEIRKRAGKIFFAMWRKFDVLSDEEKEKYFVGGGCIRI